MTSLRPIPPISVIQAVARNGAQHQNHHAQTMRHAFTIRGQNLPEDEQDTETELALPMLKSLFFEIENRHSRLKFEVSEKQGQTIVSVLDRQTGELIRQIPGATAFAATEQLRSVEPDEIKAGTFLSSVI